MYNIYQLLTRNEIKKCNSKLYYKINKYINSFVMFLFDQDCVIVIIGNKNYD